MKNFAHLVEAEIIEQLAETTATVKENSKLSLTYNRFDLAFKLYALANKKMVGDHTESDYSAFRDACYIQHIKAFSDGTFSEPGNDEKNSLEDFQQVFSGLLTSMNETGFDGSKSLIPLAVDGSILNGAHRSSVAMFLDKPVDVLQTTLPARDFGFQYFAERGVPTDMLDIAAQTFAQYSDNCFLALIWPAAQGHDTEIEAILSRVVYKKSISLNHTGAHNLLAQAYKNEPWLGEQSQNYPGIKNKLVECFPYLGDVRVYMFQGDNLDAVLALKDQVRDIFNIGKHAIHITDSPEETLRISRLLLNKNALHFLNNANPNAFPQFALAINTLKALPEIAVNSPIHCMDKMVLSSELLMAVYGLRANEKMDVLTKQQMADSELSFYNVTPEELIDNPKNHFWFSGLKFVSLSQAIAMKKSRNLAIDQQDLALLLPLENSTYFADKMKEWRYSWYFMRIKLVVKVKVFLAKVFKAVGLYSIIKKVYSKIFSR